MKTAIRLVEQILEICVDERSERTCGQVGRIEDLANMLRYRLMTRQDIDLDGHMWDAFNKDLPF